jgi:hypothetical protein
MKNVERMSSDFEDSYLVRTLVFCFVIFGLFIKIIN